MKKIIAIDADDTIFDENTAVRLFANDKFGFSHTPEDYLVEGPFNNYWERIWNRSPEETNNIYEQFVVSTYKENLKPIKGALHVLNQLKEAYDLIIVTSRDNRGVNITHESLRMHYPDIFSNVHFVPLWGNGEKTTKAKICKEIGATILIDDSFGHCELATEAGVDAILFGDYGWNRSQKLPKGMVRCKDWASIGALLIQA